MHLKQAFIAVHLILDHLGESDFADRHGRACLAELNDYLPDMAGDIYHAMTGKFASTAELIAVGNSLKDEEIQAVKDIRRDHVLGKDTPDEA